MFLLCLMEHNPSEAHQLFIHNRLSYNDFTPSLRIGHNHLPYGWHADDARIGVLDTNHLGGERCIHIRLLKAQIRLQHLAVHQFELLAIAEGLRPRQNAILESDILAVPCQILPMDYAIPHHHIFGVPEGVLRIESAVFKGRIRNVLEGVFPL